MAVENSEEQEKSCGGSPSFIEKEKRYWFKKKKKVERASGDEGFFSFGIRGEE